MAKRGAVTDFLNSFNSAYGMTKKVAQDWELGRAAQMQPTEIEQGYTSADGEQLRNIANARDAEGNPYYNVSAGQDGGYQVNSNFQLDGQTPAPAGMAPRQVTQFNGSNYAGSMDDAQVRGLRQRAMADVYAKYDPIKGMEMQQRLDQGDRDNKRFAWEEAAQPLKQRTAELQVGGLERSNRQGERVEGFQAVEDEVAKMPLEAVEAYAAQLNTNQSSLPLLYRGRTKNGYEFLSMDPKTGQPIGKEFSFNEAQLRNLATAAIAGMKGFGAESTARLSSVSKELADLVDKQNRMAADVVKSGNDAIGAENKLTEGQADRASLERYRNATLAQGDRRIGAIESRATKADAEREAQLRFANQVDGVMEGYQAAMGSGNKEAARIYASEYDQLRGSAAARGMKVPPTISALTQAQRGAGASEKPVKVADAGERYRVGNDLRISDGRGGFVSETGVLPDERAGFLVKAGVPENLVGQLRFSDLGDAVLAPNGKVYELDELQQLSKDMRDYALLGAKIEDSNKARINPAHDRRGLAAASPYRLDNMFRDFDPTLGSPKLTFPNR